MRDSSTSQPALRQYYRAYGASICSELPLALPERRGEIETALLEIDIRVSKKSLSSALPVGATLQHNSFSGFDYWQFPDGSAYVRWEDVGEVLISKDGRSIACRPFREADSESFDVYLLGQALSFALVKGGFEPVHATAVVVEDQALAFLGDCGLGKSTLAASFLQAGHRLLTDDLLLLQPTTRGILAHPGPARIKLFPGMARRLLGEGSSGVPMNPKTQKLIIRLSDECMCADAAPLAAIYVLAPPHEAAAGGIRIATVSRREAFVMLLGSVFNYVISDPERLRRQFDSMQALANTTIVRRICYPRSLEFLPLIREAILADLCAEASESAACKA
jgi:hypothetical protein